MGRFAEVDLLSDCAADTPEQQKWALSEPALRCRLSLELVIAAQRAAAWDESIACVILTQNEVRSGNLGLVVANSGVNRMAEHRIYSMAFSKVYPLLIAKAERKGRTKAEVDEIIRWLTGYSQEAIDKHLDKATTYEAFFAQAPRMNPLRLSITGVICGVRIETIEETTMREIRYLDKMINELAKGKAMDTILRVSQA